EFKFLLALRTRLSCPFFGLLVGQRYRLGALGLLGSAVIYCATARQAVDFFLRHIELSYTYFQVEFRIECDVGILDLHDRCDLGELRRLFLDRDLLFAVNACRDVLPSAGQVIRRVRLAYPEPEEAKYYREVFGCDVEFGAARSGVDFDALVLEMPL